MCRVKVKTKYYKLFRTHTQQKKALQPKTLIYKTKQSIQTYSTYAKKKLYQTTKKRILPLLSTAIGRTFFKQQSIDRI